MRTPPLLADFSHARACKPFCENSLTLPELAGETSPLDGAQRRKNGELLHLAIRRPVPPRRAHEYMAVRLCIEMRLLVPKGISISSLSEIPY